MVGLLIRRSKREEGTMYYGDEEKDMGKERNHNSTHEETPHPAVLVVDGAAGFLAEASVGFGVVKVKVVELKVLELVLGETQFPGNINPPDGEGIIVWLNEGHGVVVK